MVVTGFSLAKTESFWFGVTERMTKVICKSESALPAAPSPSASSGNPNEADTPEMYATRVAPSF